MLEEKLIERMEALIVKGQNVLSTKDESYVSNNIFQEWRVGSLSFLEQVFDKDGVMPHEYKKNCEFNNYYDAESGLSILKAAKEEIESGYLKGLETLISADIFSDFLEMCEHLLEQGYKEPSASLVGAVLEDGLRRITENNNITLKKKEDISSLNKKLADAKVYSRLTQKKIQVWNDIRNNSDHGKFEEFKEGDVRDMLSGVQKFLEEQL